MKIQMTKIDLILVKYGEIALKGLNKPVFEQKLAELLDGYRARKE